MIEENSLIENIRPNQTSKQRSLLRKYDIKVNHLTFEYVADCRDAKELERIVKILRSGEEGYYPELQKAAESRLHDLNPQSRELRREEPALTWRTMDKEEWNNVNSDVAKWKKEVSVRDLRLSEANNNPMDGDDDDDLPPIRQPPPSKSTPDKVIESTAKVKRTSDYAAWDKYDADTEILKMDLEEEKLRQREREERRKQQSQFETDRLNSVIKEAEKLSETERLVLADQEKDRGNEYFQAKEYTEAIKYYTASITIWPTAKAYNNRAVCYLKQCKYSAALNDANSTLELEPDNVKALFRRGIALQHKNKFREALADMDAVIRREPKNHLAQHIAKELREQILTLPKTVRLMTDEGLNKPKKIVEMSTSSLNKPHSLPDNVYEVNEFGLPKVMCQCSGTPRFLRPPPRPVLPTTVNSARIVELSDQLEMPKGTTKLEIVEVERSEPIQELCKPVKCNQIENTEVKDNFRIPSTFAVIDKRVETGNVLTNGTNSTNVANTNNNSDVASNDSEMLEDLENFELNCPLLDDLPEPSLKPKV